ncbi:MAG: oligosaccharide flippase family protein, partial [Parcubacteria group bacterium]|nr:oligosaccharide flippase family protein [Parcubacteria group bacterium]
MNTIRHNFGIAVLSRLIVGGISLVIVGLLTRALGPAGYGQYSLILAYLFVVSALADLGLYTLLVREISKTGADEKFIASNIFTFRLVSVIGFLGLGVLISLFLPYSGEIRLGILIAGIFAVFSSLAQALTGIFQKYLKLYYV